MPITINPVNRVEKLIRARGLRLNKTMDELFDAWCQELARAELTEDDPIMDIRPQVSKYEERAAARAAAEGRPAT